MFNINLNSDRSPIDNFETKYEISKCKSISTDWIRLYADEVSHNAKTTKNVVPLSLTDFINYVENTHYFHSYQRVAIFY